VLAVLKHEGDDSGGALMQYANLDKIYVDADFYETDLGDIKKGMIAKVSSKALPSELEGEVVSVGKLISADDKTGVVEIALKGSEIASKFLKMEVNVSIDL